MVWHHQPYTEGSYWSPSIGLCLLVGNLWSCLPSVTKWSHESRLPHRQHHDYWREHCGRTGIHPHRWHRTAWRFWGIIDIPGTDMYNHNKEGRRQADRKDWSSRGQIKKRSWIHWSWTCYYKSTKFMALTPEQRAKVSEYNATKDGGKWKDKGKGKGKPFDKKRSRNDGGSP